MDSKSTKVKFVAFQYCKLKSVTESWAPGKMHYIDFKMQTSYVCETLMPP